MRKYLSVYNLLGLLVFALTLACRAYHVLGTVETDAAAPEPRARG